MNTNDRSLTQVFHGFEAMIDARTEDAIDRAWKMLPATKRECDSYEMGRRDGLRDKRRLENRIARQRNNLSRLQAERDRAIEERDRITRLWDRKSGMI